jgi:hypothetical protein
MGALYNGLIEALQSAIGTVALTLLLGNIYQAWLFNQSRIDRERDRLTAKEEAAVRAKAFEAIADSLATLTIQIAELRGQIFPGSWRR